MKKKYLSKNIIVLLTILFSTLLNAIEVEKSQIEHNGYVILLGTYAGINDARRFANKFENENIYILKDKNIFTVRIVNLNTKLDALAKLKEIKKIVPDAILWKKMKFLEKNGFNKFHSQIYTIDSNEDEIVEVDG